MARAAGPTKPGSGKTTRAKATPRAPLTSAAPTAAVSPGSPTTRTIATPPANLNALVKRVTWPSATVIHRIHPDVFGADQFNPGPHGNSRFSPIADGAGKPIPTIYGGTTPDCAAMETVFHDVPHAPGLKSVAKRKLRNHQYSQLQPTADLKLADLSSTALRKLGVPRVDLLESEKDIYPQTRPWAEAIHDQCPDVHGLSWVSRQDDSARAIVLFEDRLPSNPLRRVAPSVDIVADSGTFAALVALADTIGAKITGK